MTLRIPGERTLPHKEQMVREILAEVADEPARHRPRLFAPLAAAASVALVAGALVAGSRLIGHDRPDDQPPVTDTSAPRRVPVGPGDVAVNGRPLTSAETNELVAACVRGAGPIQPMATPYQPGEILHAMTINAPGDVRSLQTVAFRDRTTGAVIGCDGQPTEKTPSGTTINGTTSTPIRPLAIGSGESAVAMGPNGFRDDIWLGDGKHDTFVTFSWYSV